MKIGFFYPEYYPLTSSASVHGYYIARELVKRGHKLLSAVNDKNPDCVQYPQTKAGMAGLVRDADILYVRLMSYFEHVALWKIMRPFSLPVIWEINAPLEEQWSLSDVSQQERNSLRRRNRNRRMFSRLVDAAVCVSDELVAYARDFLHIKDARCVPNGSDPELFQDNASTPFAKEEDKNSFTVLWAGNPRLPWQAMPLMFEVAKKIKTIDAGIRFVFIGTDKQYAFPSENNISVATAIAYQDMPRYIRGADVCLCLYNRAGWSPCGFYNSPLKLFDYMAAAKPVIGSRLGQIAKVIRNGENGMLTDNAVEDIIAKILQCRQHPEQCRAMGQAARRDVLTYYNWGRAADQIDALLRSKVHR